MASSYHYTFDVFESMMMRESGEDDDEGRLTTVKMDLWKKLDESSSSVELVGSIECCYVHLEAAAQNDVKDLSECLRQIGVPRECHARMIAKLMQYIESQVIVVDGRRRYESETVVMMNIYEDSSLAARVAEEQYVTEVFWRFLEFVPSGWYYVDSGVYESWAWPEEAEGDFERAVEILRTLERSTNNVTAERSRRDYAVSQSMEEYGAKMIPASEAAIASLEKIDEQQGEVALLCCMICMDEDEDGDEELRLFSRMPCKHEFHTMCIETWLRISSSCPLCRYTMHS